MQIFSFKYAKDKEIWTNAECVKRFPFTFTSQGIYDINVINEFYSHINENTKGILDIGAQVGSFSLISKFYPDISFYAFEPIKESYEFLIFNKYLNECYNLNCFNIALSNIKENRIIKNSTHKGLCTFGNRPLYSLNGKNIYSPFTNELVYCDLIDNYFINKEINLIKIDVEGWEYFVLLGGLKTIEKWKPKILMEIEDCHLIEANISKSNIYNLLDKMNYKITKTYYKNIINEKNEIIQTTDGDIFIEPK